MRLALYATFGLISLGLIAVPTAEAAPCCAGSSSSAALILGDERAKLQASVSHGSVVADSPVSGLPTFRSGGNSEETQTLKLAGSHIFADRFQLGATLSVLRHETSRQGAQSSQSAFGDLGTTFGYEFLPEWDYSEWKPKGVAFLGLTLPTGRSIYESSAVNAVDVSGEGFTAVSVGTAFIKRFRAWDASLVSTLSLPFARDFETVRIDPSVGVDLLLDVGYSFFGDFRAGAFLEPLYQGTKLARDREDGSETKSASQLRWNTGVELTKLTANDWAFTLSYIDQTLVGPTRNTTLSRTASFSVTKRLLR